MGATGPHQITIFLCPSLLFLSLLVSPCAVTSLWYNLAVCQKKLIVGDQPEVEDCQHWKMPITLLHERTGVKHVVKKCMIKDFEVCIFTTHSTKLSYSKDHTVSTINFIKGKKLKDKSYSTKGSCGKFFWKRML